mmetsp:Transcript_38355/g.76042  ORF Transcript_38355/g.76042 Transcript_38355/m.76042 type:complete len:205 (-) Transcript_38355:65-679(-)
MRMNSIRSQTLQSRPLRPLALWMVDRVRDFSHPHLRRNHPQLDRFIDAQDGRAGSSFAQALRGMQTGAKQSCWIWHIFPQFLDPERAHSNLNRKYQLHNQAEAVAFLQHDCLGPRFVQIATAVAEALENHRDPTRAAIQVMGGRIDATKLHQSATAFHLAANKSGLKDIEVLLHRILVKLQEAGFAFEDPVMREKWDACGSCLQ